MKENGGKLGKQYRHIPREHFNPFKNITLVFGTNFSFKCYICILSFEENIKQHIQTFHKEELKPNLEKEL